MMLFPFSFDLDDSLAVEICIVSMFLFDVIEDLSASIEADRLELMTYWTTMISSVFISRCVCL